MSGDGGDGGGKGGDSGGGGKGGGESNTPQTGSFGPPTWENQGEAGTPGSNSFAPPGQSGGSPEEFVRDPSQGNLTGPGPTGGGSGLPGEGGGTNSPFSFDNSGILSNMESFTNGQPVSTGGTFESGASAIPGLSSTAVPGQPAFENALNTTSSAPPGASASGIAAPAGVSGSPELGSNSNTEFSSLNKSAGSSSSEGGGATTTGGLAESLGIKNPLGTAIAGGGLVNALINGNKTDPNVAALEQQAKQGNAVAQQLLQQSQPLTQAGGGFVTSGKEQVDKGAALQQYVATGTLPQGYEDQVQQAAQAAKTRAVSNAAAAGQPTDPAHNSTLAAQLDAIDKQLPSMREQLATQLASTGNSIVGAGNQTASTGNNLGMPLVQAGIQSAGISSELYAKLAQIDQTNNAATGNAIGNFATALAGGPKAVTLKL